MIHPSLRGRTALLERTADHPYAALTSGTADGDLLGYERDDALIWVYGEPESRTAVAIGPVEAALPLLKEVRTAHVLTPWVSLDRTTPEAVSRHLAIARHSDWDFQWTTTPPAPVDAEDRVIDLFMAEASEVHDVLDDALPASGSRPGDPRVRRWYGIREGDRLVAVAADRSRGDGTGGGVGFLAGIAVAGDHRGRGLGAALTAALTRLLLAEFGVVAVGVMADNTGARRLYERLGYRDRMARTSIKLPPGE